MGMGLPWAVVVVAVVVLVQLASLRVTPLTNSMSYYYLTPKN